jgi:hypothetical protein
MTFEEFKNTLTLNTPPEGMSDELLSLWYDAKGDWENAHSIAQDIPGRTGAWIHAYLHRKEGDIGNAGYWYSIAGKQMHQGTFEEEWESIVKVML